MSKAQAVLTFALLSAAGLVTAGVSLYSQAVALIVAGVLLAGISLLLASEVGG